MKYLKMIGIAAAVAAALSALAASPAVAAGETLPNTVLCKTAETTCGSGNQYPSGTAVTATLKSGTKSKLKAGFAVIECSESTLGGTATWNFENHTPHGVLTTETFGNCGTATVTVQEKAEFVIHHEVEAGHTDTGALTLVGGRIKVEVGSVWCVYGGTAGTRIHVEGGNPAVAKASKVAGETTLALLEAKFLSLCADPAEFVAEYEVTAPKPLHVATT